MNLDELQIKISIELDDLNKQLKTVTKGIDKALGPKATKKLMADNNKIIKSGLTSINKTTLNLVKKSRKDITKEFDSMSKNITKTLNKAFDVSFTKFNSNITSAMNQAKMTVRSACNDIRRELNAALNINGNIRVTSKTSITGSATGSTNSNSSSSMASSQYIGAMIIKATNAIISNNNTNTQQLRQDIDKSTNKIVSAIKGIKINAGTTLINGNNNTGDNQDVVEAINTSTKDIVSAIEKNSKTRPIIKIQQKQNEQQPEQKKRRVYNPNPNVSKNDNKADSGIFSTKPFDDLIESVNELNFIVIKTIEQYENAVEALKNATKVANIFKRGQQAQQQAINTKMLGTGSYNNKIVKSSNPLDKNRNKEYFTGEVVNPGIVPVEVFKQLQDIIEVTSYTVKDFSNIFISELDKVNFEAGELKDQITDVVELMKKIHNLNFRKAIPSDTTSFTLGDEGSQSLRGKVVNPNKIRTNKGISQKGVIVPVEFKVIDDELESQINEAIARIRQVNLEAPIDTTLLRLNEPAEDYETSEFMAKELHRQIASLMDMAQELNEAFHQTPIDINEAVEQANFLEDALNAVLESSKDLTSLSPQIAKGFEFARDTLNQMAPGIRALISEIQNFTKPQAPVGLPALEWQDINGSRPEFPDSVENIEFEWNEVNPEEKPQIPESAIIDVEWKDVDNVEEDITKVNKTLTETKKLISDLSKINPDFNSKDPRLSQAQQSISKMIDHIGPLKSKVAMPGSKNSPIKDTKKQGPSYVFTDKQLPNNNVSQGAINNSVGVVEQVNATMQKIRNIMANAENQDLIKEIEDSVDFMLLLIDPIEEGLAQLAKGIVEELLGLVDSPLYDDLQKKIKQVQKQLNGESLPSNVKTSSNSDAKHNLNDLKKLTSDLSKITPDLNSENGMEDYHRKQMNTILDANAKELGAFTKDTRLDKFTADIEKLNSRLDEAADDLLEVVKLLDSASDVFNNLDKVDGKGLLGGFDDLDACEEILRQLSRTDLSHLNRDIKKLAESVSDANFDTSAIKKLQDRLTSLQQSRNRLSKIQKSAGSKGIDNEALKTQARAIRDSGNVSFGEGSPDSLGFSAYRIELEQLAKLAEIVGSKIKEKLGNAFSSIKGFNLGNFNFNQAFDSHVAVHQAGEIKAKLGEIKAKYKETVSEINSIASKLTAPFKKLGSIAYKGISSGLNKAKTALDKFANGCKSSWAKITGIFRKGSNDCGKAMSPLRSSLSSLASMFGLYQLGSIFIDGTKQAIKYEASLMTIQRTLGGASKALIDFANNNAQAFGISKSQVMEFGNIFSVIVSNFEKDGTKVAGTTQKLLESAGIIAGATGYDVNQVLENLRSGILGSSEAVDQLGLNLKVASLEASESFKQIANGAKSWNDLTEAQKQAIIAQEIINQTTAKYGGIVKNTSSMHNAFMAQLSNTKLALGKLGKALYTAILPALTTIMAVLEKVFTYAAQVVTSILSAFGITVDFASSMQGTGDTSLDDSVGESFDDTTESIEDATEAVEEFKGSLAGFDEINILSDNTAKDSSTPEIPDTGDIETPGFEMTEGENPLDKIGEKFKAFMDEILEPFKNAWDLLGDRWKAEWADLVESFKHFCDSLGKFLKSVWEHGGKEFVQHMAEIGLACGIAAMEIGGEILDSLARLWDHLDPAKNMNTQGFLNALNEVSVKLRDFILGLGDHFESLMANGGQDVLNALGDCFMNLGEAATRGLGVAIDALDGLIDHLDPAVNENTKNMLSAWTETFNAIGQCALDFVSLLESTLINGGQEVINAYGDMLMNLSQTAAEIRTTILTAFSGLFEHLDPATNEITQNMLAAWQNAFAAIGEASLGFSELLRSTLENGGQEVVNALGDAFISLVGLAGTVYEEVAQAFDALFEYLDPKTNTFTQNMLKAWQTAFENISSLCDTLGETLSSIMDNGGQDLLNALGDLAMQISEFFATIVGEAAECMGEFAEHIDPSKNKVTAGALDAFKYFIDSIRNFIDMLGDALGTFMDNGGQEFVNNLGDIIALVGDLAFTIGGDIINAITTFMDSWAGQMLIEGCARALEVISEVLEGLLRILEPLSPIISGVVTAIGGFMIASKVVGFIQGIATVFQTIAGSGGVLALAKAGFTALWGIIAANPIAATVAAIVGIGTVLVALYNKCEWFREAVNKVFARIKEPVEKLMETFSDLLENVTDIFGNIIDIIVGIFEGDGYKVGEAVRNMVLNIIEVFKGLFEFKQDLAEIGWNLILGLIEGIWECIKNIPQLLAGLGEFVVDFFKGLFGIHSPSTVFKELGINLIEGLIEGIESMISNIGEVFTNIKEAVVGWVQDIVGGAIEKWSELKGNIVDNLSKLYDEATEKWKDIYDSVSEKCKNIYEDVSEKWKDVYEDISEKCKDIYEDVSEKWKDVYEDVSEKCKDIYEDTEEKWKNIKNKTLEYVGIIKNDAEELYGKFRDNLTDFMENWRQNSEEKWDAVKKKTNEFVDGIKSEVEEKYSKFRDNLTDFMENWRSNSEEKWDAVKKKTNELVDNVKSEVEEKYSEFRDNLTGFMENWRSNSEGKWQEVESKTNELVDKIKGDVEEKYGKFRDNLTGFMEEWRQNSEKKWGEVKSKTYELVDKLKGDAEELYGQLKTNLGTVLDDVKKEAGIKWENIKSATNEWVGKVVSEATEKFGEIKQGFFDKIDEIKNTWGPKWDSLKSGAKTKAENVVSGAKEGFKGISGALTDAIDDAKDAAERAWEKVKSSFSKMEFKLPEIKLPKINIEWATLSSNSSWFPSIKYPKLSWNARGGIIDGITPLGFTNGSLHMGGEAGKEMVVPLEQTSFTSKIAQAIGQAVDNTLARQSNPYNNNNNNTNDNRDIVLKVNEREFARASINSINKLQRESNRTLLDI